MIDICLLGSGATMPRPDRGLSAAALRSKGRVILFDCGEGTQVALRREHISPVKIDLIALSHYHGDHTFGLPGLLQTMSCLNREAPLYITGPVGLEKAMEPILALAQVENFEIILLEKVPELNKLNGAWPKGCRCAALPAEHRIEAQGYHFTLPRPPKFDAEKARTLNVPVREWKRLIAQPESRVTVDGREVSGSELLGAARKGLSVVFSGDTMPCNAIRQAARDTDLLIHDATYGDDDDAQSALTYGHSTFRQAAELAAEAGAKRLWLTHFSQMMKRPEDWLINAGAFPGAVCGCDGMKLTLNFEDN